MKKEETTLYHVATIYYLEQEEPYYLLIQLGFLPSNIWSTKPYCSGSLRLGEDAPIFFFFQFLWRSDTSEKGEARLSLK
jgi:hypothetical protein